ncbi:hypothetical protein BN946_scf184873.g34 [Trametes cinnabarina]|uniref:Uncharacterized protein n=1 Tax=Pycnoporus cinnabarinus TaxID=5643 RepID=A0A060SNI2_PYCCI|nr:hypothetical protein BN946_scf184873.g34 [Trametes cinnabarina]
MRERAPSPQDPPTESQAGAWYVSLGKGRSRKTQKPLFCPGGKFTDPFPVVFKVPSEELADEILTYQEAIKVVEGASDVYERVRLIYTLPQGNNILKDYIESSVGHGLYPVCWGNECAVFLNVDDARNATKAIEKPIWRKLPSFKRALAYMVSRGKSDRSTSFVSLPEPQLETSAEDDEPSVFPIPVTPRRPARTQATPTATPSGSLRTATPSGSSRTQVTTTHPVSQPACTADARSSGSSLLSNLMFDLSIADLSIEGEWVYQHTRDLRGIKASHAFPVVSSTRVPSCGRALDTFLQAFGYDVDSKLLVAYACKHSTTI